MNDTVQLVVTQRVWAARYNTWLLIKLTPKGVVFSFLFFSSDTKRDQTSSYSQQHALEKKEQAAQTVDLATQHAPDAAGRQKKRLSLLASI